MSLTAEQIHTLGVVGRISSALSIVGVATIIGTFCFSRHFRNPIHRIIFINAFYNLFDVIATTISVGGPAAGNHSALCQFQGFCLQMFPLADVLWTLAMAVNVFLIVFYKYEAEDLRKLEKWYISVITTLVFLPALTFLFIHTTTKGPMYGSVTLWCAISPPWVLYRIIFYYGPIWLIIFIAFLLYGLIGFEILKRRRELKSIGKWIDYTTLDSVVTTSTIPASPIHDTPPDTHHTPTPSSPNFSRRETASSHSHTHSPSLSIAHLHHTETHTTHVRRPLSFRQYILMPVMFFVVLLAIWVAPTTNRIYSFVNPSFQDFGLLLAVGCTGSLRGFWNGVVFVTLGMKARRRRREAMVSLR